MPNELTWADTNKIGIQLSEYPSGHRTRRRRAEQPPRLRRRPQQNWIDDTKNLTNRRWKRSDRLGRPSSWNVRGTGRRHEHPTYTERDE